MSAPTPAPPGPAEPGHRLTHAEAANDLLMYRLNRLLAVAGSLVVWLCEGGYGITRREWVHCEKKRYSRQCPVK